MKVLLLNPPVIDFYGTPMRRQPLGLLYLASSLQEAGFDVELLDCGADCKAHNLPLTKPLKALVPPGDANDSSPFKLFGRLYHFGPKFETIEARIREAGPDAVCVSSLFSAYAKEAIACARLARKAVPDARIIMGGGHISHFSHEVLLERIADYCIRGEGERALPELLETLARQADPSSLPGVCGLTRDGRVFENPACHVEDLSSLPRPARQLLDPKAYRFHDRKMTQILSSRGCPFRCTFCSAHLTSGRAFRPRSVEDVVAEMKKCYDGFGISAFDFEDDNLVVDTDRAKELMRRIIDQFGEGTLLLEAMNGISAKGLDEELLRLMRKAGFRNLNISPLSADPGARSSMKRPERIEEVSDLPRLAREIGFNITAYLMIGFPGQTLDEIMANLHTWAKKPVLLAPSVFYPAPGSAVQRELFPELDLAGAARWAMTRSSLFPEHPGGLKRQELRTAFWMIRMANFARALVPEFGMPRLRELCFEPIGSFKNTAGLTLNGSEPADLSTTEALDAEARGKVALAAFLESGIPHGIQRYRRGNADRDWIYRIFPLEMMIEDNEFYRRHGVPGFENAFLDRN